MNVSEKWQKRFIVQAFSLAAYSKDPSTKVGAVITKGNRFVSSGMNGYPQGVEDTIDERPVKYLKTLHAELNAILFAKRDLDGHSLFVTHHPCADCAGAIIQTGIKEIYIPPQEEDFMSRWGESGKVSVGMFAEADVKVSQVDIDVELIKTHTAIIAQSLLS